MTGGSAHLSAKLARHAAADAVVRLDRTGNRPPIDASPVKVVKRRSLGGRVPESGARFPRSCTPWAQAA